ncbi:hypothetical protein OB919_12750 [Halobacteria archaeon AArc-curdl1]|uniref:Uncharacterized protein n=1 Tax=Natronosalvus hydrolyticus TaxID=2979988 RepID=A0AAP2Z8U1_9EURY|nr:hypothetical protein [Halobacteria archaeon AArc-curdl1]
MNAILHLESEDDDLYLGRASTAVADAVRSLEKRVDQQREPTVIR